MVVGQEGWPSILRGAGRGSALGAWPAATLRQNRRTAFEEIPVGRLLASTRWVARRTMTARHRSLTAPIVKHDLFVYRYWADLAETGVLLKKCAVAEGSRHRMCRQSTQETPNSAITV